MPCTYETRSAGPDICDRSRVRDGHRQTEAKTGLDPAERSERCLVGSGGIWSLVSYFPLFAVLTNYLK
ncbi:MAG: hypothetical protein JWM55_666 [Acidimicrobiaceae bacterium]|nr:hypothetical protein [Acidimicrobiaceae bacterium]